MNRKYSNKNIINQTLQVNGAFVIAGVVTPPQITADQNDYNPTGLSTCGILRLETNGTNRIITGIAAQLNGFVLTIVNIDASKNIQLTNQSASSTAANRILTGGFNIVMNPNETCTLWYDGITQRWRRQTETT
jgi:hypothetical protein